jgi:hypothetical protein
MGDGSTATAQRFKEIVRQDMRQCSVQALQDDCVMVMMEESRRGKGQHVEDASRGAITCCT